MGGAAVSSPAKMDADGRLGSGAQTIWRAIFGRQAFIWRGYGITLTPSARVAAASFRSILRLAQRTPFEERRILKNVHTDHAPGAIGPYSQAILANGILFTAGQIALDPATGDMVGDDVKEQTERVMQNLAAVLQSSGASWSDVVKTTIFLIDMNDFPAVNEVYGKSLGSSRPARSTVQVAALPRGALVEIDAIAVVG
jgi:2-iminobutanoate/2-iminopropanoate deaminase